MNKEDIKEFRNRKEQQEENKILEAIHNNHKVANMNYKMDKQLNDLATREQARKQAKKEKRQHKLFVVGLIGLFVLSVFALNKLNNDFMEDCLGAGNSQYTCEKAL